MFEARITAQGDRYPASSVFQPAPALDATRGLDIAFSVVLIVALAPLLVLIALVVKAHDGGPIFFSHERIGGGGRRFRCLKFRTMVVDAEAQLQQLLETDSQARFHWAADHKLKRDPRITGPGAFLRKSSLDELPQLLNVLRGDMSLVGPRPIVQAEVARYGRYINAYYSVRPGITGLWQVSGRNNVSYRRRVACDVVYARSCGWMLYGQILAMTVPAVVMRRGSY